MQVSQYRYAHVVLRKFVLYAFGQVHGASGDGAFGNQHDAAVFRFSESVLDEFSYSLRCVRRSLSVREEAERLLAAVGLDSSYLSQSPFSLSGGEKRLLSIALALAMSPDIILLDESLSGLDWKGYRAFRALVSSLKNSGIGIIFISHDPSILDLADALIVLKDGKIVFDGNPVTAMEDGLVKKSFAYSKSMELLGIPVLSLKEILRRVGNE